MRQMSAYEYTNLDFETINCVFIATLPQNHKACLNGLARCAGCARWLRGSPGTVRWRCAPDAALGDALLQHSLQLCVWIWSHKL